MQQKSAAELCQILRMVIIKIVINFTRVMGIRVTISCRFCIAFEVMLLFSSYRQDAAKRQTAGVKFTHRPKIRFFFAPRGRLVARIYVKPGTADMHLGPLGCAKFRLNRQRRVGMRHQNMKKILLFGKESDSISKLFTGFYTPSNPALAFQIRRDSLHSLGIIAEKRASGI